MQVVILNLILNGQCFMTNYHWCVAFAMIIYQDNSAVITHYIVPFYNDSKNHGDYEFFGVNF